MVKNLVDKIFETMTLPMKPDVEYQKNDPERPLYICHGFPKAIEKEVIVLDSNYPSIQDKVCIPEKIFEFDFYNEYEGFIYYNHLNIHEIDYSSKFLGSFDYVVDIDNMILYRYKMIDFVKLKKEERIRITR